MGWSAFTFKYIKPAENIHTTNLGLFLAYPYVWYWIITWLHLVCSSTDVQHQYLTSPPGWLQSFKQGRRSPLHSYYGDVASVWAEGMGKGISTTQPLWRWWLWCPADRKDSTRTSLATCLQHVETKSNDNSGDHKWLTCPLLRMTSVWPHEPGSLQSCRPSGSWPGPWHTGPPPCGWHLAEASPADRDTCC